MMMPSIRSGLLVRLILVQSTLIVGLFGFLFFNPDSDVEVGGDAALNLAARVVEKGPRRAIDEFRAASGRGSQTTLVAITRSDGQPVPGSDPVLIASLKAARIVQGRARVALPGGMADLSVASATWRGDDHVVAVSKPAVVQGRQRLLSVLTIALPVLFLLCLAVGLALIAATRTVLRPLDVLADAANAVDPSTLPQRLPTAGVPREITPLVDAVNRALDRLASGFERQRRFTADAAHELRTPVAVLRMRLDTVDDVAIRDLLFRDVQRLTVRVEQLLSIARLESDVRTDVVTTDITRKAAEVLADVAPIALRQGVALALISAPRAPEILAHHDGLRAILSNLIENAMRFAPQGSTIEVTVDAGAILRVSDEGPGIPPEHHQAVFAPFVRGDGDDGHPGAGLGLAISLRAAEAMGAMLAIEPGRRGTTFVLECRLARADLDGHFRNRPSA